MLPKIVEENNGKTGNAAFERQELDIILESLANTAPEPDEVNYDMIKSCSNGGKDYLFKINNKWY